MGAKGLDALIRRAVQDSDFRQLLESKPEYAFAGFDLSCDEKSAIKRSQRYLSLVEMDPKKISATLNAVGPYSTWR